MYNVDGLHNDDGDQTGAKMIQETGVLKFDDPEDEGAYHEIGHYLAARRFGWDFDVLEITIVPRVFAAGGSAGHIWLRFNQGRFSELPYPEAAAYSWAGIAAQAWWRIRGDEQKWYEQLLELHGRAFFDLEILATHPEHRLGVVHEAYMRRAMDILREERGLMQVLANQLFQLKTLTDLQILDITNDFCEATR